MIDIIQADVEKIVTESNAHFFQIFIQTTDGKLYAWNSRGFTNIVDGHNESYLFRKKEASEQYYKALRDVRGETMPALFRGGERLDIVPLILP
jgi:hypothetical protein